MKRMTEKEFKNNTLEMLKVLTDFCEKHNLRYILDYGTLLGAIRHKGFIPWDDDIDVSMPRSDYEKLYRLLEAQGFSFNDRFKLASTKNKYDVHKAYFNIIDISTITESKCRKKKYYYPVWIDIFPCDETDLDYFSESGVKFWTRLAQIPLFESKHKIKGALKSLLTPFMQINFRLADVIGQKYNNKGKKTLHNYHGPYGKRDVVYKQYFDDYIYREFEGSNFRIPRNYDERLSNVYGDYMKLPPVDKRKKHVNNAFYLNGATN